MNEDRKSRAERRKREWQIKAYPLDEAPPSVMGDAAARMAAVWEIAHDEWALLGKEIPTYTRDEMPTCWRRLGEPPVDV